MKVISQAPRELRQMVRCLDLYYRQGRHQKDIARSLGVSAATVSRLLKRAFDEGFVRVELDLPRREELEAGLIEHFGLRDAGGVAAGAPRAPRPPARGRGGPAASGGEAPLEMVALFPNTLVGMMAAKYRPHVTAYALPVQHLLSLREIERERRRLLRDPAIRTIYEAAQ